MKTQAAVLREPEGRFEIEELDIEDPRPDEVLVRVAATGICHTDITVQKQWVPVRLPVVLGHEGAGVVEAVGSAVRDIKPGDHVVMSVVTCGKCRNCLRAQVGYCSDIMTQNFSSSRPDGSCGLRAGNEVVHSHYFGQSSFSSLSLAYERNVVKVRDDLPLEMLGPLGCGIQTGAGSVLNALDPEAGSSIAIFGTGGVGMSAVMAAVVAGCTPIIAIDNKDERLQAAINCGATHTINAATEQAVQQVIRFTGGGADYALDTTGSAAVIRQAVESTRIPGVCGVVGGSQFGAELILDQMSIFFGRTVRGIINGDAVPKLFIPLLIDLYVAGRFPFDKILGFYDFAEINTAIADSQNGRVVKPVLRIDPSLS